MIKLFPRFWFLIQRNPSDVLNFICWGSKLLFILFKCCQHTAYTCAHSSKLISPDIGWVVSFKHTKMSVFVMRNKFRVLYMKSLPCHEILSVVGNIILIMKIFALSVLIFMSSLAKHRSAGENKTQTVRGILQNITVWFGILRSCVINSDISILNHMFYNMKGYP